MWEDPIVAEVRRARDEYARALDYDLDAIFADLRQQQEKAREQGLGDRLTPASRSGDPVANRGVDPRAGALATW
jgi:hypothetical protein